MKAMDMVNISRDIEQIKHELHELDTMYGKAKAQVLMNATPVYVFDNDNNLYRAQYNEETKHLLEEISKQHCEAIKRLADRYGIEIFDADGKEKMEAEQKDSDTKNDGFTFNVKTIEDAIIALICTMPLDKREINEVRDAKSNQTLISQKGEIIALLDRGDGILAENVFSYQMNETGIFKKGGTTNESDNEKH